MTDLYTFVAADLGLPSLELSGIAISTSDPSRATLTASVIFGADFSTILFDLDTGVRSAARTMAGVTFVDRLALAPDESLFTLVDTGPRLLGAIDPATASVTPIGSCSSPTCIKQAIDFDLETGQLFSIGFWDLQEISPITGETLRSIGPTGLADIEGPTKSVWGLAVVVPEPHTGVLLSLGLGALAWRRRPPGLLAS